MLLKSGQAYNIPPAVSYMWGPPKPVSFISVNGQLHGIRKNLYDFMLNLWVSRESDRNITLWIDQVCIDQENIEERNHQVAQMARIYSHAERVFIWLGLGSPQSDIFIDALQSFPPYRSLGVLSPRDLFRKSPFSSPEEHQTYYDLVSSQKYWSRVWIIQEVLLARLLTIVWGNKRLNWDVLARFLGSRGLNDYRLLDLIRVAREMRSADGIYRLTWGRVCRLSEGTECGEPRDKIYGLLGLVDPALRVQPDYTKSISTIVTEIVKRELAMSRSEFAMNENLRGIEVLCCGGLGLPEMPSCPEISQRRQILLSIDGGRYKSSSVLATFGVLKMPSRASW